MEKLEYMIYEEGEHTRWNMLNDLPPRATFDFILSIQHAAEGAEVRIFDGQNRNRYMDVKVVEVYNNKPCVNKMLDVVVAKM